MAIDDQTLASIVSQEIDDADTWQNGELARQQRKSLKYYNAEPFGNEKANHSQVVTRDVMETVEGIMPELMKIFAGGDAVVEFEATGPEDMDAAEQATDYLNHLFMRRLDGFNLTYKWCKDALLMKNSVIKVGWTKNPEVQFFNFANMTQPELDLIDLEEESAEVVEQTDHDDGTFDVRIRRELERGQPFIEHIPSEEFRIKERSKSIAEAEFVGHVARKTRGELIQAGFDADDITQSTISAAYPDSAVVDARFSTPQEGDSSAPSPVGGPENQLVEVADAYVRIFDEEKQRVVIMNVIQVGNKILFKEEVDSIPLINLSPIMMPHKFTGIAVTDLVTDIQEIRSTLYRQMLDNLALQNSGRYVAVDGQVNLQDLLDNKIGGVVRTKSINAVSRLDTPNLSPFTVPVLENLDLQRENRTGVSRMTQGLDPNALTSNTAATAVNQVMSAAQQKILLIARIFAETGFKELFWHLYRVVRLNQTQEDVVKLRGKFVPVRPFDWKDRKDMTVTVGIGNGNKDQELFHLNNISQLLQQIGNSDSGFMVSHQNVYNLAREFIKNSGRKNVDLYITDPSTIPPPQPQPSPEMVMAQGEAQKDAADAQKKQVEAKLLPESMKLKQQELQLDAAKFEWQKRIDAAELAVEADQDRPVGIGDGK